MSYTVKKFDNHPELGEVFIHTLTNKNGLSASVLNYGGILQSLIVPDKNGVFKDIVCGFDTVSGYLTGGGYFGSLVGRYANRIAKGKFTLDGKEYVLNCNEGGVKHLHGGNVGYNERLWDVEHITDEGCDALRLSIFSPDGEEGYPGNLKISVIYVLTDDDILKIKYEGETDKRTVINLTNHAYFNIAGYDAGRIDNHIIQIDADRYTEVDSELIPTGKNPDVTGTKFDLRKPRKFTEDYDHNFCINGYDGTLKFAAEYYDPDCGRCMDVYTTLPGVQIYSAVCMENETPFKNNVPEHSHQASCFETQFFPDTPNEPSFPSCVFGPDKKYTSETQFRFGIKK